MRMRLAGFQRYIICSLHFVLLITSGYYISVACVSGYAPLPAIAAIANSSALVDDIVLSFQWVWCLEKFSKVTMVIFFVFEANVLAFHVL